MSTEHEGQATSTVVFDGVCVLCNGWVHFLLRHDRRERFRFAAMQTPAGRELLGAHGLDPEDPVSFLLIEDGHAWTDTDAIVRVLWTGRCLEDSFPCHDPVPARAARSHVSPGRAQPLSLVRASRTLPAADAGAGVALPDVSLVHSMRACGLAVLLGVLGGCASAPVSVPTMSGDAARPAQVSGWIRSELYFAVGNEDGSDNIDEASWREFLDREVTPRFPDGLTVIDGYGQWRFREQGRLVRQRCKVLVVLRGLNAAPRRHRCNPPGVEARDRARVGAVGAAGGRGVVLNVRSGQHKKKAGHAAGFPERRRQPVSSGR